MYSNIKVYQKYQYWSDFTYAPSTCIYVFYFLYIFYFVLRDGINLGISVQYLTEVFSTFPSYYSSLFLAHPVCPSP